MNSWVDGANTVLIFVLTCLGVWLAWRQTGLSEGAAARSLSTYIGTRGVVNGAQRYRIEIELDGPGRLHAVAAEITHAGVDAHTEQVEVLTSASDAMTLEVVLDDEAVKQAWLVTTWAGNYRGGLRTEARRARLTVDDRGQREREVWRYRWPFAFWRWFEAERRRCVPRSGRRRPVGKWKVERTSGVQTRQGPRYDPTRPDE